MEAGSPEVAIYDRNTLASLRESDGKIHDAGGLSLACLRAGDLDDFHGLVNGEELQRSPKRPVSFGGMRHWLGRGEDHPI